MIFHSHTMKSHRIRKQALIQRIHVIDKRKKEQSNCPTQI